MQVQVQQEQEHWQEHEQEQEQEQERSRSRIRWMLSCGEFWSFSRRFLRFNAAFGNLGGARPAGGGGEGAGPGLHRHLDRGGAGAQTLPPHSLRTEHRRERKEQPRTEQHRLMRARLVHSAKVLLHTSLQLLLCYKFESSQSRIAHERSWQGQES